MIFACSSGRKLLMAAALSFLTAAADQVLSQETSIFPAHDVDARIRVQQWIVIGPLPIQEKDALASFGGESAAILTTNSVVTLNSSSGVRNQFVSSIINANTEGIIDLNRHFNLPGRRVAYAFCWLRSAREQTVQCFVGSGDAVKIWLNGEPLFEKDGGFFEQSCAPRQHQFALPLHKGNNRLLLKSKSTSGDWAFIVETASGEAEQKIVAEQQRLKLLREFQDAPLRPGTPAGFVFAPGPFPSLEWTNSTLPRTLWGEVSPRVRWFDGALNEVSEASKPGRYAAYVEADLPYGNHFRRALTFFCVESDHDALADPASLKKEWAPNDLIDAQVWHEHQEERERAANYWPGQRLAAERQSAIVLAGLAEMKPLRRSPLPLETAAVRDEDFHLALKRKILGVEQQPFGLNPPRRKLRAPAPVLGTGSIQEGGMDENAVSHLREICREWAEEGGEPFTALVARHGIVVFHEAFNCSNKPPVSLATRFSIDSITKTVTSLMFAQFVDQGLMNIDDPVGLFLPDLPTNGENVVTFRHCLTHATGLEGHGAWGGMSNPWLENVIANGHEYLRPGQRVIYNGMGFDLAGKAMEMVSGKSIFRLMHENFLDLLGAPESRLSDCGFTGEFTAEDLARIGQLMLNRGSYGDLEFFSPEVFNQMLPRKSSDVYPQMTASDWEYGWGLSWMRDASDEGQAHGKNILGHNTVGHGALSSTVLRVDLDNELVIVVARPGSGKDNGKYLSRFLIIVGNSLR